MTGLVVANCLTAALVLLVGIAILLRGKRSPPAAVFFVVSLSAAMWLACFALMFAAREAWVALTWARLAQLPVCILGAAGLHLTYVHLGRPSRLRSAVSVAWIGLGAL